MTRVGDGNRRMEPHAGIRNRKRMNTNGGGTTISDDNSGFTELMTYYRDPLTRDEDKNMVNGIA